MTPAMLVSKYSDSERLDATAENFPALKNFWDMNHVDGLFLRDTIGTQHIENNSTGWFLDETGFSKTDYFSGNYSPQPFEAPGDRAFIVIGSGLVSAGERPITIGNLCSVPVEAPGISVDFKEVMRPAFLDASNYANHAVFSFKDDLETIQPTAPDGHVYPNPSNPGIRGCFAAIVDPTVGTCNTYWGGRVGKTASYDPIYETHSHTITGSLQGSWPQFGNCWTTYPGNRFEWVALMYFESGAPNDMEEAMRWMAQYDDFRLYPGWKGKQ